MGCVSKVNTGGQEAEPAGAFTFERSVLDVNTIKFFLQMFYFCQNGQIT